MIADKRFKLSLKLLLSTIIWLDVGFLLFVTFFDDFGSKAVDFDSKRSGGDEEGVVEGAESENEPTKSAQVQTGDGKVAKQVGEKEAKRESLGFPMVLGEPRGASEGRAEPLWFGGPSKIRALTDYSQNKDKLSLSKGSIKFSVLANWPAGGGDMILFLGNFNGQDNKNVMAIIGSGRLMVFDTYDNLGSSGGDTPDADLGFDYLGKNFNIRVSWNFEVEPKVKRIYVNDKLTAQTYPEPVPTESNPQILIGSVENLIISSSFEE